MCKIGQEGTNAVVLKEGPQGPPPEEGAIVENQQAPEGALSTPIAYSSNLAPVAWSTYHGVHACERLIVCIGASVYAYTDWPY